MPRLASLRAARPGELKIDYRDLPNGGAIAYRTDEPRLVTGLHHGSLSDHGRDAMEERHYHPGGASAAE